MIDFTVQTLGHTKQLQSKGSFSFSWTFRLFELEKFLIPIYLSILPWPGHILLLKHGNRAIENLFKKPS